MITLCIGALPRKSARGVYQVIQFLRELSGNVTDDNFLGLPDEIDIPAVRIRVLTQNISFIQEIYSTPEKEIKLKILDRDLRSPKVMLCYGDPNNPDIQHELIRTVLPFNPFKDIKKIEEYEGAPAEYHNEEHTLIKAIFENMDITFLKWKNEVETESEEVQS